MTDPNRFHPNPNEQIPPLPYGAPPSGHLPYSSMPTTLAPFVLPPDVRSIVPSFNLVPPSTRLLPSFAPPPIPDHLISYAPSGPLMQGLHQIMDTKPTIVPDELLLSLEGSAPPPQDAYHIEIPVPVQNALPGFPSLDERTNAGIESTSRADQLLPFVVQQTTIAAPYRHEHFGNAIGPISQTQSQSAPVLPQDTRFKFEASASPVALVPITTSPPSFPPHVPQDILPSNAMNVTLSQTVTEQKQKTIPKRPEVPDSPVTSPRADDNSKKRSRAKVLSYATLNEGEWSDPGSPGDTVGETITKRPKRSSDAHIDRDQIATYAQPSKMEQKPVPEADTPVIPNQTMDLSKPTQTLIPSQAAPTPNSPPKLPSPTKTKVSPSKSTRSPSKTSTSPIKALPTELSLAPLAKPLLGAGAQRRFGTRSAELLAWNDKAPQSSNEAEKALLSFACLSDLYTDLHNIDLETQFSDTAFSTHFVSSLHNVLVQCRHILFKENGLLTIDHTPQAIPSITPTFQLGTISAVSLLYLLASPSFNKQHMSDECLDDCCTFVKWTIAEFIRPVVDGTSFQASFFQEYDTPEDQTQGTELQFHDMSSGKPVTKKKASTPKVESNGNQKKRKIGAGAHENEKPEWMSSPYGALVTSLLGLTYEALEYMADLVSRAGLPDEYLAQFVRIGRETLFTHGLLNLQPPSLCIMRNVFVFYPSYRPIIFQEITDAILDLNRNSQNAKSLTCGPIHLVTALVLILLQSNTDSNTAVASSSTDDPEDEGQSPESAGNGITSEGALATKLKPSTLCKSFIKTVFDVFIARVEDKTDVYGIILETLVNDLISIVFTPDWPAADLLLKDIVQNLIHASAGTHPAQLQGHKVHDRQKTVSSTLLSLIATKLVSSKLYMTTANLLKRPPPGDPLIEIGDESDARCPLCTQTYNGKSMVSCSRCWRWFHQDCFGIWQDIDPKADWYCDACLLGFVVDMVTPPNSQPPIASTALNPPSNDMEVDENSISTSATVTTTATGSSAPVSTADSQNPVSVENVHLAMRILLLNYMNWRENSMESLDAKRYMLRHWRLESENSSEESQRFLQEQWRSNKLPIKWPPQLDNESSLRSKSSKPTSQDVSQPHTSTPPSDLPNPYMKLLYDHLAVVGAGGSGSVPIPTGLLPTKLACQNFMVRMSIVSTASQSIFLYFPKILDLFVTMLSSDQAKQRALALRAITNMVDADMSLLREKHVYDAVEARLIDPSPLTREKALNMLGRFIIMRPDLVPQYASLIQDRIEDSAISVRRRAIRIIRSICLLVPNSPHIVGFCAALAKRMVKHGETIKEMAISLFKEIWFVPSEGKTALLDAAKADLMDPELPQADMSVSMMECDFESRELSEHEKAEQILAVLKETLRVDPENDVYWFVELMGSLKGAPTAFLLELVRRLVDFICRIGEEAELEFDRQNRCEQLLESYEGKNEQMRRAAQAAVTQAKEDWIKKRLLYSVALHHIAKVLPELVSEHFHQLRVLLTSETPSPSVHALEKRTVETLLSIIESIIPHTKHTTDDVWVGLLKDLSQFLRNHGMPVIEASVKCATVIVRRTGRSNWVKSLYTALANSLKDHISKKSPSSNLHPQSIIRFLYTLGMLLKCHPLDPPPSFKERDFLTVDSIRKCRYGSHVEQVYGFIVQFWKDESRDVKTAAVLALGLIAPGSPGIFVRTVSEDILSSALAPSSLEQLKAQAIKTINEFLSEEAAKMANDALAAAAGSVKNSKASSSSIATASNKPSNTKKRQRPSDLDGQEDESSSTNQGAKSDLENLVHSDESRATSSTAPRAHVPTDTGLSNIIVELYIKRILSLGLDRSIAIRGAALSLLEQILRMGLTHPAHCVPTLIAVETDDYLGETAHRALSKLDLARVQNRIADGILHSFQFQRAVFRTPKAIRPLSEGNVISYHSTLGRLYTLFAEAGRVARNNFLAAAFGLFEGHMTKNSPFDSLFVTYLTLLIAQLPFTTQEEALFAVYHSNMVISNLAYRSHNKLKLFYDSRKKQQEEQANTKSASSIETKSGLATVPKADDVNEAIISWHLIMLKRFFRNFYCLDAERCRSFLPSESKATPISQHVTTVNIQEHLQKIDSNFDGFLVDPDWAKKPIIVERLFIKLKAALKGEEEGFDIAETKPTRRRKSVASHTTTSSTAGEDGSSAQENFTQGSGRTPPKGTTPGRTTKPRAKKTQATPTKGWTYYDPSTDGDWQD